MSMTSKELLEYFCELWEIKYQHPYIYSLREIEIFENLLNYLSSTSLKELIEYYLSSLDSIFASDGGHTIGLFRLMIPQLVAGTQKQKKLEEEAKEANQTDFERLLKARNNK